MADEAEALVALGQYSAAAELVDWLEARGRALDLASALAAAARGRGMLAAAHGEHEAAIAAFERAVAEHDRAAMPFERARTRLHLGAAQRRAKHKHAAGELAQISGRRRADPD